MKKCMIALLTVFFLATFAFSADYGSFSPTADKILTPDGSVVSILTGVTVQAANANGAALYATMSPRAAKYLLPDGSTVSAVPLQAIIAGTATSGYCVKADGSGGLAYGACIVAPLAASSGGTGSSSAPSAGQIPVGNAGGTAYAPQTMSSDCTINSAGAITCLGRAPATFYDYQTFTIDAGIDSVLGAPAAAAKFQGTVGSDLSGSLTPLNVSYSGTCTISAPNVTTCSWATSGTQTLTFTQTGLTVGKLYRFQFTPTSTGQVPTITATSGVAESSIPTVVTAVVEVIYFRASATTAVFTATNTTTATWSTASTTVYECTQPAIARTFSHTAQQTLKFDWMPPGDWDGSTVYWNWTGIVDNATPPSNTQTAICQLSGVAFSSSDSLSQALGTAVTSTFTADATYVQYDEILSTVSSAVTIANSPVAGKKIKFALDCLTSGTYAQGISMTGWTLKYGRTPAH